MNENWFEEFVARDVERARRLLSALISSAGLTRQEVDERLGRRHGFTSNLLTGRIDLKQEHVVAVFLVLKIHPALFYQALYPRNRPFGPIDATQDFAEFLAGIGLDVDTEAPPAPRPPAPPVERTDLRQLIDEAVQRALAAQAEVEKAKRARRPAKKRKKAPPKRRAD